jgi:cyclophilin family peptidyl-prolyl cis-trans isomerase/HEAT repeat protein
MPNGRAVAVLSAAIMAAACGVAPARPHVVASAPAPAPLAEEEAAAFVELLRLEDTHRYDGDRLDALARAPSAQVRARAALAMARLRDARGVPSLERLLQEADTAVAARAAFAMGQLDDSSAVPALARALQSHDLEERPTVAAEAAYALGKLRSESAHQVLQDLLRRTPGAAPRPVIEAALLAVWRFPRPEDTEPITRWTASADPGLRWPATYALVRRMDPRASRLLITLSDDSDPRVRSLALRGLTAALADSAAIPRDALIQVHHRYVTDPDYTVRINAIRSLGAFQAEAAADILTALLESSDRHVRVAAMESLGRIGSAARASVARLAAVARSEAEHVYLRQTALETLALVDTAEARAVALELRGRESWRLRLASARAIGRSAPSGAEQRGLIRDPDGRVAAGALAASLAALGDSVAPLQNVLLEQLAAPDPVVRATAAEGLATLRDPATLAALLDAYAAARSDTDNDAALATLSALAALRSERLDPARAFFARFPRSPDFLVRRRAAELFPSVAEESWGAVGPAETRHSPEVYRSLVQRWSAPRSTAALPEVEIVTELGSVRLRLHGDVSPLTVYNFLELARRGYFDGQEWPRVVPNFVVQGGDPRGDMSGGPGYSIRDEISPLRYGVGSVGMALSGPDTGGSQFFLTHSAQPHLDGVYTLFGEVSGGQELLEQLLPGDRIIQVRSVE